MTKGQNKPNPYIFNFSRIQLSNIFMFWIEEKWK